MAVSIGVWPAEVDQGFDVLDLPDGGVGLGVSAVPAAAPVVGQHAEVLGEEPGQLRLGPGDAGGQGAVNDYEHRAVALSGVGDGRSVSRGDCFHEG
jgi:hypothetical protein